jgi:16S rRNA (adenine1518-N6/adenine1519-N6)-dimethyltransferase
MDNPNKKLGQHWLFDKPTLEAIVSAGQVKAGDVVLEIGPGQGTLTDVLLQKGALVTAVEFDVSLAGELTKKYQNQPAIKIITQDIRKFNFNDLPSGYKIVANIPYYLTSLLIRQICDTAKPPLMAVLLVQKEVAERVCAYPGEMSILSVATQIYYEASLGQVVKAELFSPPPKVDSQILILKRRAEPLIKEQDSRQFFRIVKAGFSERRKKLRSSLSGGLGISKAEADDLLHNAGIDSNKRAQDLSLQNWSKLMQVWLALPL